MCVCVLSRFVIKTTHLDYCEMHAVVAVTAVVTGITLQNSDSCGLLQIHLYFKQHSKTEHKKERWVQAERQWEQLVAKRELQTSKEGEIKACSTFSTSPTDKNDLIFFWWSVRILSWKKQKPSAYFCPTLRQPHTEINTSQPWSGLCWSPVPAVIQSLIRRLDWKAAGAPVSRRLTSIIITAQRDILFISTLVTLELWTQEWNQAQRFGRNKWELLFCALFNQIMSNGAITWLNVS